MRSHGHESEHGKLLLDPKKSFSILRVDPKKSFFTIRVVTCRNREMSKGKSPSLELVNACLDTA